MSTEHPPDPAPAPPEVVVVTGLSGAGRGTAARCLEDQGFYVVDNLPPSLLAAVVDLGGRTAGAVPRIAVVTDVRSRAFSQDLRAAISALRASGVPVRVLFLEASDEALVRRFESVRRPHPLQSTGRLLDGIAAERERLLALRGESDLVVDTTSLNVHELRVKLDDAFRTGEEPELRATVLSFGYKYGLPVDADLVVDCRFLPNPHWVPELRESTGRDQAVSDYVMAQPGAQEFLEAYSGLLELLRVGYSREGKRYVTVAVGCTGGKHRSVAMAEEMTRRLEAAGVPARVMHRDLGRE